MSRRARRRVKDAILRSRFPFKGALARIYLRIVERARTVRAGRDERADAGGLAIPPPRLRVLVAGTAELDRFLDSGEAQAAYLRDVVDRAGSPLAKMNAILDFGCGCGRIARWLSDLPNTRIDACDYNDELVRWCDANLDFVHARKTGLAPPLGYPSAAFDFVYAFSVFTHLSVELARDWLDELGRVVRPGGLIWFTIHGESYRDRLLPEQRERFDAGEIVVWLPEIEGTNICGAYWPPSAVPRMLSDGFEIVEHFDPQAQPLTAQRAYLAHDAYLVRRLGGGGTGEDGAPAHV
jgi:SAM-dependent methyltransferase